MALNVFFRNESFYRLAEEDFHHKNTKIPIKITLTFEDLSEEAKKDLKAYYRQGKVIAVAVAEWDENSKVAEVKQHGIRLGIKDFAPFFEAWKRKANAGELAEIYEKIRKKHTDLPAASTKQKNCDNLRDYEDKHTELKSEIPGDEEMYGFAGTYKLEKFIQWIYIPAVKDASTEQVEGAKTALGQILNRTIRKKVKFKERIEGLKGELAEKYAKILESEKNALLRLKDSIELRLKNWGNPNAKFLLRN